MARYAPAGSPLAAALAPPAAWPLEMYGLAEIIDSLWRIAWIQGGSEGTAPEPITRPGRAPDVDVTTEDDKDLAPVSPEEMESWYRSRFTVSSEPQA